MCVVGKCSCVHVYTCAVGVSESCVCALWVSAPVYMCIRALSE